MGQAANPKRTNDNEARAYLRTVRISPRKLNLVAGLIRGKSASKALTDLTFSKRRIAEDVKKLLMSAIANAENNHNLDIDRLFVAEATVGKAIVMKRFHARGRGKAASIEKFFSNMTIIVRERSEAAVKPTAKAKKDSKPAAKAGTTTQKPAAKKTAAKKPAETADAATGENV